MGKCAKIDLLVIGRLRFKRFKWLIKECKANRKYTNLAQWQGINHCLHPCPSPVALHSNSFWPCSILLATGLQAFLWSAPGSQTAHGHRLRLWLSLQHLVYQECYSLILVEWLQVHSFCANLGIGLIGALDWFQLFQYYWVQANHS